jgi:hypothetical protein
MALPQIVARPMACGVGALRRVTDNYGLLLNTLRRDIITFRFPPPRKGIIVIDPSNSSPSLFSESRLRFAANSSTV